MKVRFIISDRSWEYRLHANEVSSGGYYVTLRALDGARLAHPVCIGPIQSLDAIRAQAAGLYLRLVAMRETAAKVIKPLQPYQTESVEHLLMQPAAFSDTPHDLRGDPRYDDSHPDF